MSVVRPGGIDGFVDLDFLGNFDSLDGINKKENAPNVPFVEGIFSVTVATDSGGSGRLLENPGMGLVDDLGEI
jgi:hypothetical protein